MALNINLKMKTVLLAAPVDNPYDRIYFIDDIILNMVSSSSDVVFNHSID